MNENRIKQKDFLISSSEYLTFTVSSFLYILTICVNCYVCYCMYEEGHQEWFATSLSLMILFSLFTQIFSHIFFTYNNIGDKSCSPYLQRINSKSGDDNPESVVKKEFLDIACPAVCPHSGYPDRLWTDKDLSDLKPSQVQSWQKACSQSVSIVLHLLHIGPVLRYIHLLKFRAREMAKESDHEDIEEKKIKDIERYFCKLCLLERAAGYSLRDITLLRLFEALEAAPQVLLQVYMIFYSQTFSVTLILSSLLGITHMSFCLALAVKYQRMPRTDRYDQTVSGLVTMTLYKMFLIAYRVLCLGVFGAVFRGYLILLLFTHSLIMLLWILYLDTNFSSGSYEEIAFNFTVAMLKAFTFVNVADGRSRNRIIIYHVCTTIENGIIAAFWYYKTLEDIDHGLIVIASLGALYIMGIFIKTLYYTCCHPTKHRQQGYHHDNFAPPISL